MLVANLQRLSWTVSYHQLSCGLCLFWLWYCCPLENSENSKCFKSKHVHDCVFHSWNCVCKSGRNRYKAVLCAVLPWSPKYSPWESEKKATRFILYYLSRRFSSKTWSLCRNIARNHHWKERDLWQLVLWNANTRGLWIGSVKRRSNLALTK